MPKRLIERRRRNHSGDVDTIQVYGEVVRAPAVPRDWHPIAQRWMRALKDSAQREYYEPSDWAAVLYLGEMMSRSLMRLTVSAELFAVVWKGMGDVLTMEASRRRVRIEIDRVTEQAEVEPTSMEKYRERLGDVEPELDTRVVT